MTSHSYNLNVMENGQLNRAFEFDNGETQQQSQPRRASLALTAVEVKEREQWDKPIEFLLSCVAMSVGLGNVWRFPYTAYSNGGGAFIIPYLIVLFFIGRPIYFLEMAIGQFSSRGQVKIWKMAPFFKGVGYGSAFGSACVCSYYCSLMALTLFYFFQSFQTNLPWTMCNPEWEYKNITCVNNTVIGSDKTIPELYFKIDVLHEKEQIIDGIGLPDWKLSLCLLVSWVVILLSLIKGVKSAGKVAYFTALFPYVVLIVLLIRGLTLPGSFEGVTYLFYPQWEKLLEVKVWAAAVTQCFFSLTLGFGTIIMFASFNPISHNVYRDAMIISVTDTLTSLLASVTIFAVLGNLAHETGKNVEDVVSAGPGLAFVSYPEAIAKFQYVPQLFAVLFFLMLFTLGVGSAASLTNAIVTLIHDQFSNFEKKWMTTGVCVVGFFSGLMYLTPGGQFILELVDSFGAGFVIFVMALLEIIGMAWVYGLSNLVRDIEFMIGFKLNIYWKFCWGFLIPIVLSVILVYSLIGFSPSYNGQPFPDVAIACGWAITGTALCILPMSAIHSMWTRKSEGFLEKFLESLKPTNDWGPRDRKDREIWLAYPHTKTSIEQIKECVGKLLTVLKCSKESE